MNTISAFWDSFSEAVVHKNAPEIQRKEMRRAFYAGAMSALELVEQTGRDSIELGDDVALKRLQALGDECTLFYELARKGIV